jgi:hypothetical protein
MKTKTASIERYHVWGTPHYCLALVYRGKDYTPHESPTCPIPRMIPDDADGIAKLKRVARAWGFSHVQFTGDWDRMKRPARQSVDIEMSLREVKAELWGAAA